MDINANNDQNINNDSSNSNNRETIDKRLTDKVNDKVVENKLVSEKATTTEYCKRFELMKLDAIALWTWNVKVDNCSICRNHIMDLCIECQARTDVLGGEECPVSWGACRHAFHFHCISRWTQSRNVCPLDNSQWKFAKLGN